MAQTLPKNGDEYESVSLDLNGDGKKETVSLVAYNVDSSEESFWGRLRVSDASGKTIWEAPKVDDAEQPFAFGMWAYGVSGLEWVGDIDSDGKVELITKAPVSDLRPPTYHRYRWTGKAFEPMSSKMLLADSGAKPAKLLWRDPFEWDGVKPVLWVSSLSGSPSQIIAEITDYRGDNAIWGGAAVATGNGLGLTVSSWNTPYGPGSQP